MIFHSFNISFINSIFILFYFILFFFFKEIFIDIFNIILLYNLNYYKNFYI